MSEFTVVVSDQVFPSVDVERALIEAAGGELVVASGDREDVLARLADADAVLTTYFAFGADDIAAMHRCKIIARYGIGVDNVDLDAARDANIVVTNVPDYCIEEVAAHTLALILALVRRVGDGDRLVRSGGWGAAKLGPMRRLSGMTVGLVGHGRIAREVSTVLRALGVSILVADPYVSEVGDGERLVSLEELLSTADVVSVHCPLTPQTRGLIDASALASMKPGAFLVNTSRGPVVVLDDVLASLRSGHLAGAGLDVFDAEPPSSEKFRDVDNLIATPHMAFYSLEAIAESQRKATEQVLAVLSGKQPTYKVN